MKYLKHILFTLLGLIALNVQAQQKVSSTQFLNEILIEGKSLSDILATNMVKEEVQELFNAPVKCTEVPIPVPGFFKCKVNGVNFFYKSVVEGDNKTIEITRIIVNNPAKITVFGKTVSVGKKYSKLGNVKVNKKQKIIYKTTEGVAKLIIKTEKKKISKIAINFTQK